MTKEYELIESLANTVYIKGFSAPAIFLLEMYKPLSGVFYNLALAVFPVLNAIFGFEKIKDLKEVMSSPKLIEELIQAIEKKENETKEKGLAQCRE